MKLLFSKVLASSLLLLSLHRTCSSTAFTSPYQSGNTIKQYKGPKGASRSDGSALFQSSEVHNTPDVKRTQKRWPSKKGSKKQFKKGQKGTYKKNYKNNYKSGNFGAEQGARNKAFQVNRQITQCETAYDILDMMASKQGALTSTAGGGALTSINFSTALHRMAKYIAYNGRERKNIVVDPRFAMFISSLAEAYAGVPNDLPLSQLNAELKNIAAKPDFNFSIRESTNIVWGLTKIGIVPPQTALPLSDHDSVVEEMLQTSLKLRREVIEARQKGETKATWIPTLSHLTAKLTDAVARYVTAFDTTTGKPQEMANMLWAYASLQRSSEHLFDHISGALCSELSEQSFEGKPQEVSNTLWAYATYGYTGKYRIKMMEIAADVMRENKALLGSFKPQEFSNTAWAFASILGERRQDDFNCETTSQEEQDLEDKYCVEIMRHVGDAIISRCDEFKSQEISNTVWAMGCLGFGIGSEQAQGRNVNDYVIIKSDDYDYDEQLVKDAIAAVAASAVPRLRVFKNQELNNLAYGCARIMAVEPTLLSGIARELSNPRRRLKGQDVGTTLWSFATMEFFDEEAFKRVASNVDIQAVERWNPQELSNLIWAIGTAQLEPKFRKAFDSSFVQMKDRPSFEQVSRDPLSISFAAVAKELMKRPQEFKTQEIKDSLWGFSKVSNVVFHFLCDLFANDYI